MSIDNEDIIEYPQETQAVRSRRRAWAIAVGLVGVAGIIVAGCFAVPPVLAAANQAAYNTAQAKAQAAVPAAPVGDATSAGEQQTLANSDTAGGQAIATEQAALQAQAAAAAAAQAAAEAAATQKARASDIGPDGLIVCPPGSQANSGDSSGATSCFPDICFHITLPDPNHPECVTPFKP
jgi:hypothetical protein